MIEFRDQFRSCRESGFVGDGEFLSFDAHPENLPLVSKEVIQAVKEKRLAGLQLQNCLRFGGVCNASNPECRNLRGVAQ